MSSSYDETRSGLSEGEQPALEGGSQQQDESARLRGDGTPPGGQNPPPSGPSKGDPAGPDNHLSSSDVKTITATSTMLCFLLAIGGRWSGVQLTIDSETVLAMAGMAVGIGTLIFAVLAVVNSTTHQDWLLRIVLLAMGTVFTALALGGFIRVVTWSTDVVAVRVDLYLVLTLLLALMLQVDWLLLGVKSTLNRLSRNYSGVFAATEPYRHSTTHHSELDHTVLRGRRQWIRYTLLAVLPLAFLIPASIQPAVLLMASFVGALITLTMAIMVITLMSLPAVQTRATAEGQHRLDGNLDSAILNAIDELQAELRPQQTDPKILPGEVETIPMISHQTLVLRLRANGRRDNENRIKTAVDRLSEDDRIALLGDGLWSVPSEEDIQEFRDRIVRTPVIVVRDVHVVHTKVGEGDYWIERMDLSQVRRELVDHSVVSEGSQVVWQLPVPIPRKIADNPAATTALGKPLHVPVPVLDTYYLPQVPRLLSDPETFFTDTHRDREWSVYVSRCFAVEQLRRAYAEVHHQRWAENASDELDEDLRDFRNESVGRMILGHYWDLEIHFRLSLSAIVSSIYRYLAMHDPDLEQFLAEFRPADTLLRSYWRRLSSESESDSDE